MAYQYSVEDGKGNVLEVRQLCTLEEYKIQLVVEMKELWRNKFPTLEKQINLSNGLLDEKESAGMRELMKSLLDEYEQKKSAINSADSLEKAHSILYG